MNQRARSHEQSTAERGSHARVKSARHRALEDDRPTVVPDFSDAGPELVRSEQQLALERQVLFEARAAEEKRRARDTHEDERPTRRVDAKHTLKGLVAPQRQVVPTTRPSLSNSENRESAEGEPAGELRRTLVRVFAVTLFLAVVASIVAPLVIANYHAIQQAIVTLLRSRA